MSNWQSEVYFLNIDINKKLTGIERASMLRAKVFKEHLQSAPTIVTVRYNHLFRRRCAEHAEDGLLHPDLTLINMYEQLLGTREGRPQKGFVKNDRFTYKAVPNTKDYRVYRQDEMIQYVKRFNDGTLDYINYFAGRKKVGRYKYDSHGYLSAYQHLDVTTQQVTQEDYYHIDGYIRLKKYLSTEKGKNVIQRVTGIVLFNAQGVIENVFRTEDDLIEFWLEGLFDSEKNYHCIIDKNRIYYQPLMKLNLPNVTVTTCIHAMHTRNHINTMNSAINRNYRDVLEDIEKPEAIIVLTKQQKRDIEERFGLAENVRVIPHTISLLPEKVRWQERNPLKVVALSRYSEEKRLDQMIEIFAQVVERMPTATLEIYGFGAEKAKLLKKIKELEMSRHIFLKNYVSDISDVYDSAALSLLTSRTEAFSLVTMESLAHGCPVISYDIKYGPSDMIVEGENGFLIPLDEQEQFADKIVELLKAPRKLKKMSAAAYRLRDDFSGQQVSRKWSDLLNELER